MKIKCTVIFVWIFLAGLSQNAGAEEITFNSLLPPAPTSISIQNAQYLFEALGQRQDVKKNFSDIEKARWSFFKKLDPLKHLHDRLPCLISAEPESIFDFSLPQLIRAYLIFDALQNGDLVSQIGKIIDGYKEGDYYEPGGLGLIKNDRLLLILIPSIMLPRSSGVEAVYLIPGTEFLTPHIFAFHMHPIGRSGPAPGPSFKVEIDNDGKEAKFDHDIGTALVRAKSQGEYHHLLISKLGNRRFNVDYYAAEKIIEPPSYDPADYCGKLVGFKIIDLGIWRY